MKNIYNNNLFAANSEAVEDCNTISNVPSSPQKLLLQRRNISMVRKYHMIVLLINHISAFYMRLYIYDGSHIKYTYIIDRENSHIILPNHTNLSLLGDPYNELLAVLQFNLIVPYFIGYVRILFSHTINVPFHMENCPQ